MIMYMGLAITIWIMSEIYQSQSSDQNKKYLWVASCILVLLFMSLRDVSVGSDTIQYVNYFKSVAQIGWGDLNHVYTKDVGFFYILKILGLVSTSQLWFMFSTSFISLIGVLLYIKDSSRNPILSLYFFITLANFMFVLSGMRQAFAMSICLVATRYIKNQKLIPYVLYVLFAAMCHKSALLFLPMYFIARRKITVGAIFTDIFLVIIAITSYDKLLGIANEWLGYNYEIESVDNGLIMFFVLLIIISLAYITRKNWMVNVEDCVDMNTAIIALMMWALRLVSRVAERPSMYWQNAVPVILTNSICSMNAESRNKNIIKYAAIGLSLLLYMRRVWELRYTFIWS